MNRKLLFVGLIVLLTVGIVSLIITALFIHMTGIDSNPISQLIGLVCGYLGSVFWVNYVSENFDRSDDND